MIGTAVGTFFTGSMFSLNEMNQVTWQTSWRGLEALADFRNLSLGFAILFLARINGLLFLINTIDNEAIRKKAHGRTLINSLIFLIFFIYFIVSILISDGYAYDAAGMVTAVKFRYFHNFIEMPVVTILFLAGVLSVLYGIAITIFIGSIKGIWFSGSGTILAVFALFLVSGLNGTAFYPSVYDPENPLQYRMHRQASSH